MGLVIRTKQSLLREEQPWVIITHEGEQMRLRVWKNGTRLAIDFEGPQSFIIRREKLINGDGRENKGGNYDNKNARIDDCET